MSELQAACEIDPDGIPGGFVSRDISPGTALRRTGLWHREFLFWCDANPETVFHLLPAYLKPIAAKVGIDPVLALMTEFGGRSVYIPKTVKESPVEATCRLQAAMGREGYSELCRQYGGTSFPVPMGKKLCLRFREEWTQCRRKAGARVGDIATELGINVRTVRRIFERRRGRMARRPAGHA